MRLWLLLAAPLWAQDFHDYRVLRVAAGFTFTDGPAWSRDGYLIFGDVPNNTIWRFTPGEKPLLFREDSGGAQGHAFDAKGRLYICESRARRVIRIDARGAVEVLAERWEGKRLNGPNDIVVRRDGHAYFTDPAFGRQAEARELDFYGIYHISPKDELRLAARWEGRPNGIALSPGGRTLYVADSDARCVRACELNRQGEPGKERLLIRDIDGPPGGLAVDEKGNLYVAANQLLVYSPQGKLLHTIELAERPSNCAFGDADLGTLFITARGSVYAVRLGVKGAGSD